MSASFRYFLLYKPFGVLCQFSNPAGDKTTLKDITDLPDDVYPLGRLDEDSEGLILLTNDASANRIALGIGTEKEYYVQVEGAPDENSLEPLRHGVVIRAKKMEWKTLPALAKIIPEPDLQPRIPPIRFRKNIPDTWLSIILREGKNRQVRKMTAAIGFPTLRLVRWRIGAFTMGDMKPGEIRELSAEQFRKGIRTK